MIARDREDKIEGKHSRLRIPNFFYTIVLNNLEAKLFSHCRALPRSISPARWKLVARLVDKEGCWAQVTVLFSCGKYFVTVLRKQCSKVVTPEHVR